MTSSITVPTYNYEPSDPVATFLHTPKRLLIDGTWREAQSGESFISIDPASGAELATIAKGDKADVDAAVVAARAAFETGAWAKTTPAERSRILGCVADLIEDNAQELAEIEALDVGTPVGAARGMIDFCAETFRYYAGWPTKIYGETNPSAPGMLNYTLREPMGVCGLIAAWNGPLSWAWKLAPALACGNTVVLKPAETASLTVLRFAQLVADRELLPSGVLNIVTGLGLGAGSAISEHRDIDKVAFTGSTEVGKLILQASIFNLKRVSLELGGKSPNIIFDDADVERAAQYAMMGFCSMSGQACVAGSRIFVQQNFYESFAEKLSAFAANMRVGHPMDPTVTMGPLASRQQYERVTSYVSVGEDEGAVMLNSPVQHAGPGYYVAPTIFTGVLPNMRIAREEVFGPVAALIPFKDEDDAVLQANDTVFGLAAAVWTRDVGRAHRVARAVRAGTVWINTYFDVDLSSPFGGYKQSGLGRELGAHSIDQYTQAKSVFVRI